MPDADGSASSRAMTAAGRYQNLTSERESYLRRGREASALTIPSLLPPEDSHGEDLLDPFQSVGARGVNNLSAKLLLALFPPGGSIFRLTVGPLEMEELVQIFSDELGLDEDTARAEIENALSEIERTVVKRMEQRGVRTTASEVLKHLLVIGNVCLQILKGGGAKLHRLDRYVVKRDASGNVVELIVKERVSKTALPKNVQKAIADKEASDNEEPDDKDGDDGVDIYTWVQRDPKRKRWMIHQEAGDVIVPKSKGWDPLDKPRFHALRATKVDGEDYARSFVEGYMGDLHSLESLTQSIVEGSAAAARLLLFNAETGLTDSDDVANAPNGAVVPGNAEDISILRLEKNADFAVTESTAVRIEKRLEQAFLLFSSIQRNAERVTAEEIRTVANELEQTLGGLYSILAQEFQRPLVDRVMFQLQRDGDLPKLPSDKIEPQIVAGLEGLSRSSDLTKLRQFAVIMRETFGEQHLATYFNPSTFGKLTAANLGLEIKGLVRSEEEVQAIQRQAQEAALAEKMGPQIMKSMSEQANQPTQEEAA